MDNPLTEYLVRGFFLFLDQRFEFSHERFIRTALWSNV